MLLTFNLSAQDVVIESFYPDQNPDINIQNSFNRSNYERKVMPDGSNIFFKKKQDDTHPSKNRSDINLKLVFKYETGVHLPYTAFVVNATHEYEIWINKKQHRGSDTIVQAIDEAGTYDIVTEYKVFGPSATRAYVMKELVEIQSDTTITVNITEAKNHIVTEVYNENGVLTEPHERIVDTINDTIYYVGGNISDMLLHRFLKSDWLEYSFSANRGDKARTLDFYVSDVSKRYTIAELKLTIGEEKNGFYFNKFVLNNGIYASDTMRNNPDDFVMHNEFFKPTPESNIQGLWRIRSENLINGKERSGWMCDCYNANYIEKEGVKVYLDNQLCDPQEPNRIDMLALPGVIEEVDTVEFKNPLKKGNLGYYLNSFTTDGPSIALNENREVKYLARTSTYFSSLCDGGGASLPEHPAFSFMSDDNNPVLNSDNCPMYLCNLIFFEDFNIKYNDFSLMSQGRYGEIRQIDKKYMNAQVKYNSDIVYEGQGSNDFSNFMYQWASEGHPDGAMEINLTNNNVEVDGIEGQNLTAISYDQTREDWLPPQLQMLQFRNVSGKVTDRFTLPGDGIVELATGDFEYSWDNGCFSYKEGNVVDCYYTPTGTNSWTKLDLTVIPEYFWHGYGDFYQAPLSSIEQTGINVWYDLKIVCTDAAGNSMQQTISPAFEIFNNVSVEEYDQSGIADVRFFPNPVEDVLTVECRANESYGINILNAMGEVVYVCNVSDKASIDLESLNLSVGIYFIQLTSDSKTITKKIIYKN